MFVFTETKSFVDDLFVALHSKSYISATDSEKTRPAPLAVRKAENLSVDKEKPDAHKKKAEVYVFSFSSW